MSAVGRSVLLKVIALSVFVPFAVLSRKQPVKLASTWAALCSRAAAWFVSRDA